MSASTRRTATPAACAAATTASARPGTRACTVSKNAPCTTSTPPARSPAASDRRHPVAALRDRAQPVGTVVDGVAGGDDGEQDLRRADVAGRLLPADVLLAGLQRQPQRRVAVGVAGQADEPARKLPGERLAHRQVARVRPAEAQRHPEALGGADDGVRPQLAGRGQQRQRQQVRGHGDQAAAPVHLLDQRRRVAHHPGRPRVRQQQPEQLAVGQARRDGPRSATTSSMPSGSARVRSTSRVCGSVSASTTKRAVFAFPARRSSVIASAAAVASSSSDALAIGQAGEVRDHGLEVQQRLQPALADLGLVGRVGGVPGRVLEDVAPDHRRGDRAAVAQPDHRDGDRVAPGERAQLGQRLGLGRGRRQGRGGVVVPVADRRGQRPVGQLVERGDADGGQHGRELVRARPDVPVDERHAALELVQRRAGCLGMLGTAHGGPLGRGRSAVNGEQGDHRANHMQGGTALPLCPHPATGRLRDSPGPTSRRRWPGFPRRRTPASLPPSLSRGVFPARSWGLRGSGEELLLRRPARVRTLPRGVVDRFSIVAKPRIRASCRPTPSGPRIAARNRGRGRSERLSVHSTH